jgi:hypothetical protein
MQNASKQTYNQTQSVEAPPAAGGPDAGTALPAFSLPAEFLAKLRAADGEGLSRDPKNNPRKTIKLLTDKDDALKPGSNWYREGARAGQYLVGDKLCDDFVLTPILYLDVYVEWKTDGGPPETHYTLPPDAKWDPKARCYFRANGNSVEDGAEIVGLVNHEVCWLNFRGAAVAVARGFNWAASNLTIENVQLPFFGANWGIASLGKRSSKGKNYQQTTYEYIASVGQPGGPSLDDFDRCQGLYRLLTKMYAPTKLTGTEDKGEEAAVPAFWENPPESDLPPPIGDDPRRSFEDLDDIPPIQGNKDLLDPD